MVEEPEVGGLISKDAQSLNVIRRRMNVPFCPLLQNYELIVLADKCYKMADTIPHPK